jgi:large conductance mechanosensitive channel
MATATPPPAPNTTDRLAGQAKAGLSGMGKVLAGFRDFIARGNAVELAVGVAIGAAFGVVVTAITDGFIGPLVALVLQGQDLSNSLSWHWGDPKFSVGLILDALLKFLITAAVIYFVVVLPLNAWAKRRARGQEPVEEAPTEDVALLREIRDLLAAQPVPAALAATAVAEDAAPDEDAATPPSTLPPSFPPED